MFPYVLASFDFNVQQDLLAEYSLFTPKVAIIGSGAAGASAAYFLEKEFFGQIDVFERNDRIGGRARNILLNLTSCSPICHQVAVRVELGASIIAKSNKLLVNAVHEFGLEEKEDLATNHVSFGIYNFKNWNYRETNPHPVFKWIGSWLSLWRIIRRYGVESLYMSRNTANSVANQFMEIYQLFDNGYSFTTVSDPIKRTKSESLYNNCSNFLGSRKVDQKFLDEMVAGISRTTYLQDPDDLNAFACSIAIYSGHNEMFTVKEGNSKIYEKMLEASQVFLNTTVTKISKSNNRYTLHFKDSPPQEYDYVVLAAPFASSGINLEFASIIDNESVRYVKLYVTIVYGQVDPFYFGLDKQADIPATIFTPSSSNGLFHSFSIVKDLNSTHTVVKMFSAQRIQDVELEKMYIGKWQAWRHDWVYPGSYPYLGPISSNFDLPVKIDDRFFYANNMERWASCMEMQTMAGFNIAKLILNDAK